MRVVLHCGPSRSSQVRSATCGNRVNVGAQSLPSNLFQFRAGTGEARCVLDCITALQNGADLLWIETEKPHIG
ncbi:hypothetical protein, partial [Paraburkholderia heleia]|uniref:hypothetical protein n=1 Tax=Paraburkholderia heleia TaxID=634127 RepID=UPI0031CF0782